VSRFEEAVEIDAPASRTFAVVSDPRLIPRIDPSASVRLLSGGWTDVGSRHHVTNRYGGSTIDSVHEITRYERPVLMEERITTRGSLMTVLVEVRAVGADRSVLIMRGDIAWGGSFTEVVGRLLQPMIGPPQRRRELRRLKAAIESWNGSTSERQPHLGKER
jgi:hypothetical protein